METETDTNTASLSYCCSKCGAAAVVKEGMILQRDCWHQDEAVFARMQADTHGVGGVLEEQ